MSNAPVMPSIEVDEDGTVDFVFYRADGLICAAASLLKDGTAFAHILDGTKTVARERMTAEEISEAASIAADEHEAALGDYLYEQQSDDPLYR